MTHFTIYFDNLTTFHIPEAYAASFHGGIDYGRQSANYQLIIDEWLQRFQRWLSHVGSARWNLRVLFTLRGWSGHNAGHSALNWMYFARSRFAKTHILLLYVILHIFPYNQLRDVEMQSLLCRCTEISQKQNRIKGLDVAINISSAPSQPSLCCRRFSIAAIIALLALL